jgi:hypothetical protein
VKKYGFTTTRNDIWNKEIIDVFKKYQNELEIKL